MDESGYQRYDAYLEELEAIDPERLADCIRLLGPLLDQALNELGYADGAHAGIAGRHRADLAVPEPVGDLGVELVQPKVLYHYADPSLESLSDVQKQVLRMGPDNNPPAQGLLGAIAGAAVAVANCTQVNARLEGAALLDPVDVLGDVAAFGIQKRATASRKAGSRIQWAL